MKLNVKGMISFVSAGIIAVFVSGTCYPQPFSDSSSEILKNDIIKKIREYAPALRDGILKSPNVISKKESRIIQSIRSDERIVSIIYLSSTGRVRWHKVKRFIGATSDELQKEAPLPTDALLKAYINKTPQIKRVPDGSLYELVL